MTLLCFVFDSPLFCSHIPFDALPLLHYHSTVLPCILITSTPFLFWYVFLPTIPTMHLFTFVIPTILFPDSFVVPVCSILFTLFYDFLFGDIRFTYDYTLHLPHILEYRLLIPIRWTHRDAHVVAFTILFSILRCYHVTFPDDRWWLWCDLFVTVTDTIPLPHLLLSDDLTIDIPFTFYYDVLFDTLMIYKLRCDAFVTIPFILFLFIDTIVDTDTFYILLLHCSIPVFHCCWWCSFHSVLMHFCLLHLFILLFWFCCSIHLLHSVHRDVDPFLFISVFYIWKPIRCLFCCWRPTDRYSLHSFWYRCSVFHLLFSK